MTTAVPESRDELEDAIDLLRSDVRDAVKDLTVARKALDALARKGSLDRLDKVVKERKRFASRDLTPYGYGETASNVLKGIERYERNMRRHARGKVINDLKKSAGEDGLRFEFVSDSPPVVLISPLMIELDPAAGRAEILYARETVLECGLDAETILEGREKAMGRIKKAAIDSEDFFELLHAAYAMVCARTDARMGDRVDIVDLLGPLAVLSIDPDKWRKLGKVKAYPRYLLAYQLSHLRRDGLLRHKNKRVELGTATGGSTRNKRNVLFVPTTVTDGQYYLSIRFLSG